MKKRSACLAAAAVAAGSLLTAAPAHAGPGDPVACLQSPPDGPAQNIVWVSGFDITADPSAVPNDVNSAASFAYQVGMAPLRYFWCVAGDTADPGLCLLDTLSSGLTEDPSYVSQDPYTGAVTVHGNELVGDASACLP